MYRTRIAVLLILLLAGVGLQTGCSTEKSGADNSMNGIVSAPPEPAQEAPAEVASTDNSAGRDVSAPERWLDFTLATPNPAAVRPDGRRVVVKAGCETVLYDLESGTRLHAWTDRFSLVRFSGDGRFLLTVEGDEATVWDAETLGEVRRFTGRAPEWNEPNYRSFSSTVAVSYDGGQVAIANRRGSFHRGLPAAVLLYDTSRGDLRQTLTTPEETEIGSVAFVPKRHRLLVGYSSRRENEIGKFFYALWDTKSAKLVSEFPVEVSARVSPDGRWIAGGMLVGSPFQADRRRGVDSTSLTVWQSDTGRAIRTLKHVHPMRDFTFSPDSERILTALEIRRPSEGMIAKGGLAEWDVQSGKTLFEGDRSPEPYASVAYSPDGSRRFATTEKPNGIDDDVDHRLCGWEVTTGATLPIGDYAFASYSGREELFFYSKGDRFIDLEAPFAVRDTLTGETVRTLPQYRVDMSEAAFMPDGEKFLLGSRGYFGASYLTDCPSGHQSKLHLRDRGPVFIDGGRMLFTYDTQSLHLFDVISNNVLWELPLHAHYQRFDAAISSDAKHIVVSQESDPDVPSSARVILVDTSQPDRPQILERYAPAVAFHPDGTRFVAASPEAIDEFDARSGDRVRTLWSPPGRPLSVAYSPDGSKVLACGVVGHLDRREPVGPKDQGWAILWDAVTNRTIPLEGHTAPVTTVAFGPGGTRCATGSLDTTIRLWDSATGNPLFTVRGHIGGIHRIAYSPRGDRILSAAEDGGALWNVARFANPPVESTPLAKSFTPVESVSAIDAASGVSSKPTGAFLPASTGSQPASLPAYHQADWIVIEVGKVDRSKLPPDIQRWLSQAKRTDCCDALPPSAEVLAPGIEYEFCGSSRDGHRKVYVSRRDKKIVLFNGDGETLHMWDRPSDLGQVAISPSGNEVFIARRVRTIVSSWYEITVYDAGSGISKRVIREDDAKSFGSIAIDPKERTIMMRMAGNEIVLSDYQSGDKTGALGKIPGGAPRKAEYSPSGRFVVMSKFPDLAVTLFDPITLAHVKTLSNFLPVLWFEFSPDERRLLVGQSFGYSCRDLLTMWDIDSGLRLWSRCGPWVGSTTFSPDGRRFVSYGRGSYSRLATLWDAEVGEVLCAVLTSGDSSANQPVLAGDGASLHLGTPEGPRLWPRD